MITIHGLRKQYPEAETEVLADIDLEIGAGEFASLVGRSGCGKTTLLNIIGGLDSGFDGNVAVGGRDLRSLRDGELARFRRRTVGFVFQAYHLLDHLSCAENITLAARFDHGGRRPEADKRSRAIELLQLVGLPGAADRSPTRLSGGERQRVAIARSLFNRPPVLLLDEPTGNLDAHTGGEILSLLEELHRELGMTVVAATHDEAIEAAGRRLLRMVEGSLVEDGVDGP